MDCVERVDTAVTRVAPEKRIPGRSSQPFFRSWKLTGERVMEDWKTIENPRDKYQAYLCSREWSVLKEEVHKRSGGRCERCKTLPGNAVHHLNYERKFNESLDDLQHNCHPCHNFTHAKSGFDPAANSKWSYYLKIHFESYHDIQPIEFRVMTGDVGLLEHPLRYPVSAVADEARRIFRLYSRDSAPAFNAYMTAIATLDREMGFTYGLWVFLARPEVSKEMYSESIGQIAKCVPRKW